jgi:hypothetical protein
MKHKWIIGCVLTLTVACGLGTWLFMHSRGYA